jgi:pentatricopeptide repeat protein
MPHILERKLTTEDGKQPAILYCHCNVGNRREAEQVIELMIEEGFTVYAFDFSVCSLSRSGAHFIQTQADLSTGTSYHTHVVAPSFWPQSHRFDAPSTKPYIVYN